MQWIAILLLCVYLFGCAKPYSVTFVNPPCLIPHDKFDFKLCGDFQVLIDGVAFTVPEGFTTDLSSVPRPLWWLYAPNDSRTIPAAVLHDFLYHAPTGLTRKQADDIFYHSLIAGNTRKRTAIKYYLGVRCFGWTVYQRDL